MKGVFINHTNHASASWSQEQREAALQYGHIVDAPFPDVPPSWTKDEVAALAKKTGRQIRAMEPAAVLCQGEFTYTYYLTAWLKEQGITVVAACSERVVAETVDKQGVSHKTAQFRFVRFREY